MMRIRKRPHHRFIPECPSCKKPFSVLILHWLTIPPRPPSWLFFAPIQRPMGVKVRCRECGHEWDDWYWYLRVTD